MKKALLATILVLGVLTLTAQGTIKVNYKGDRPSISDFAWALLSSNSSDDDEADESQNAVKRAWTRHQKGLKQDDGVSLTIDGKNGYVLYQSIQGEYTLKVEMCYWNESDGKHKLFAYNTELLTNGRHSDPGQYDGLVFYRYDNATKKMSTTDDVGFDVEYSNISYSLPRSGKNIVVTRWNSDGTIKRETLKWNGRRFAR